MSENRYFARCVVFVAAVALLTVVAGAVKGQNAPSDKELKLISVLQSDAPAAEKAITCKRLAVYGTQEAVPAFRRCWRMSICPRGPGSPWR